MARFKVVVTDQVFPSTEIERGLLESIGADLVVSDGTFLGVSTAATDADALLNTYMPIGRDLVQRLKRCRVIARYGVGTDNIDVEAAAGAGIVITNVPDYSVHEVATHALAMILALVRRIPEASVLARGGSWGIDSVRPIRRASELTVGLFGYGRIARKLASFLAPVGVRQIAHDPYAAAATDDLTFVSFEELLATSDVISIHAPLTPETRGLFNGERIRQMRPGAMLVNTSRGALVVLEDLLAALRSGHLARAALDVLETEPPIRGQLDDLPANLLLTPHMAYYSEESLRESQYKAALQVVKVLTGQMPDYAIHSARTATSEARSGWER